MPLPSNPKAPWPPKAWADIQRDIDEASAWYSGDEAKLTQFYGGPVRNDQQRATGWSRFWTRRASDQNSGRQRLHVPAAADVAAVSADLLFGEEPRLVIPEAHDETEAAAAAAAEERLAEIAEQDGWASTLLEGAEVCAALGGVYLRVVWDATVAEHPMLDVVHADHAVPEFRWGRLVAVTFWRELLRDEKGIVWRHLERHEISAPGAPGRILHGLYAGDAETLGVRRSLGEHPDTAAFAVDDDGAIAVPDGVDGLVVRYVPNVLPNRKHRGKPVGRSDTAGCEAIMDALDETYTAWMREIRLVKPRIIVPNEFLEKRGRGGGASFDVDAEVFAPLEMDPTSQDKAGITVAEFTLHTQDYERTSMKLFTQIVQTAGYSPQSFGIPAEGVQQTATEVDAREGRSDRSTGRKQRYWAAAVEDIGEVALIVDRAEFGGSVVPMRPRVEWGDSAETDIREAASALNLIKLAEAASVETRVRILHPDWDDTEVIEEADKIKDETGLTAVADPTGGIPGAGPT